MPRTPDAAEDEGWVLAYVYDAATNERRRDPARAGFRGEPIATIDLPTRVPYGFHGNWIPDRLS